MPPIAIAPLLGVVMTGLVAAIVLSGGASARDALLLGAGVGLQTVAGYAVIHLVLQQRRLRALEALGLSGVAGALIFLAVDQLLRSTPLQSLSWWLPALVGLTLLAALGRAPVSLNLRSARWLAAFVGILALGAFLLGSLWMRNPIAVTGWVAYFPDLSYHEAVAQGLALLGAQQTPFLAGFPFDYHWFADGWAGGLSRSFDLPPYVALSRGLYAFALVCGTALAWAWGSRVVRSAWAGPLAGLMVVGATFVGMGAQYSYTMFLTDISPTHTFAIPITLAISLIATRFIRGDDVPGGPVVRLGWLALLVALGAGVMGSRAPHAMIVLAALGLTSVALAVLREWSAVLRCAAAGAALVVGMIPVYLLVLAGDGSRNVTSELVLGPNNDIMLIFGLLPYTGPGDNLLAYLALVASVTAGWAGLLVLALRRRHAFVVPVVWGAGAGLAALVGVVLLSQGGRSQISFLWAGAIVVLPLSGAGLAVAARRIRALLGGSGVGLIILIGAASSSAAVLLVESAGDVWFSGYLRWGATVGPWIVAATVAAFVARRAPVRRAQAAASALALALGAAAITGNVVGSALRISAEVPPRTAQTPLAINRDHFDAAAWVRDNIGLEDGYLATNRQCDVADVRPPQCISTSWIVSALTGRPTLIEGFSYAIQSLPPWALERTISSFDFGVAPTPTLAAYLRDQGVHWVWVDHLAGNAGDWSSVGEVAFVNDSVTIVRLG